MKIHLYKPSSMEGKLLPAKDEFGIASVMPTRYAKTQRTIFAIPFECTSDSGVSVDKGFIAVNVRTGKLSVEHCTKMVPMDVDAGPKPVKGSKT